MVGQTADVGLKARGKTSFAKRAGLGKGPGSIESYCSQAIFKKERDQIFRRAWLAIGREEEIAKPGDFIVRDVEICDALVFISRARDGAVHAFHNACPHGGNQVVREREGLALAHVSMAVEQHGQPLPSSCVYPNTIWVGAGLMPA